MNIYKRMVLASLLGIIVAAPALADDLYVISNPGIKLTPEDIREVFLGDKQFAGSVKIAPADNTAAQEAFLAKVMKMDAAKYDTSWTKKAFRDGLTPPASKAGDADVINFVKSTPGAVGYVTSKPGDVTVIQKY